MKRCNITQSDTEVVVCIDDDVLHIVKTVPKVREERLDQFIAMAYPITYENLVNVILELVGDSTPGNKIQAIKIVRRLFSPMGLREAKQIVDTVVECNAKELLFRE
jgi:ribosomal protein L7/L12